MKFNYSEIKDDDIDATVINSETGNIIVVSHHGNNKESRKFLKMATKLINEKFENNIWEFENEYNNILNE